jgi:hypothetical protein
MTIALTMRTHDRTLGCHNVAPGTRKNYLHETLTNMARARVLESPSLTDFIVNGDLRDTPAFFKEHVPEYYLIRSKFQAVTATEALTSNLNAAAALEMGANTQADWILFCEDDLDVCDDFIEGIAAWLERYQCDDLRLYAFGSTAADPDYKPGLGKLAVTSFFGTTCYALRRADARLMADYVRSNPLYTGGRFEGTGDGVPVAHDLHFHQWHAKFYPDVKHVAFSNPSFVQHIGLESGISNRTHEITYKSWPGREWRYRG